MNRQTIFQNCAADDVDTVMWIQNHKPSLHKKINQFLAYSPYPSEEFMQLAHETAIRVKPRAEEKGISFDRYFWRAFHKVCCLMAPLPSVQKMMPNSSVSPLEDCLFCSASIATSEALKNIKKGAPVICPTCDTIIPKEHFTGPKTPCFVEEYRDSWETDEGGAALPPTLGFDLVNDYYLNSAEDRMDAQTYRLADLSIEDFAQKEAFKFLSPHQQNILSTLISTKGSAQQVADRFQVVKQTIQKTRERAYGRMERESESLQPLLSKIPRP